MERKRAPVAPPSRRAPTETLPFKTGQVIGSVPLSAVKGADDLTTAELHLLQRGGYKDGDPVPDLSETAAGKRLRAQVEQTIREAEDIEGLTPIDPTTPPLPLKPFRDIRELPPDEAAAAAQTFTELGELRNRLVSARTQAAQQEEIPYLDAPAPSIELIDDIGLSTGKPRLKLKQPAPPPPPVAGADISDLRVTCPKCNHDLNGELFEPTLQDKVGYIALVMGEQKRFRRTVSLFGGRITVTFRSLLTSEEGLAMTQVDTDAKDNKICNLVLYAAMMDDYRMLMSIESVQRKGKPALQLAPIAEYEFDATKNKTALPEFKEWIDEEVFLAASVRHAISHAHFEFTEILKLLEAKAPDSDFFDGIE